MNIFKVLYMLLQMRGNVRKPRRKIEQMQNKKLRKLIKYAYAHSEYYKDVFQKVGINPDNMKNISLADLPTINKEQLMDNFDRIVTNPSITQNRLRNFDEKGKNKKELFQNQYHIVHSSGSTGAPRYFVYDRNAWDTMLVGIIRGALWGSNGCR